MMLDVGIKELKNSTSKVMSKVRSGDSVIVTKRGVPEAVILSIDDAEDFVLAHADEFVKMRLAGRRDHKQGKSIALDEI